MGSVPSKLDVCVLSVCGASKLGDALYFLLSRRSGDGIGELGCRSVDVSQSSRLAGLTTLLKLIMIAENRVARQDEQSEQPFSSAMMGWYRDRAVQLFSRLLSLVS